MEEENNVQNEVQNGEQKNGLAIAGMVVGIISIIFRFYCITGIVGLILSILGLKKSKENGKKGFAIAGIICSIVGIVLGIIAIITIVAVFSEINENKNEIVNSLETLNSLEKYYNY